MTEKMIKRVLILLPVGDKQKRQFEEAIIDSEYEFEFIYSERNKATSEELSSANIIIGSPPIKMISNSTFLEWVQLGTAGADEYTVIGALPKGTALTNATGAFGLAISEYMLGVLLEIYKKLHLYRDNQLQNFWMDMGSVKTIENSVVLSVGLGDIGGEFSKRMKALGAYTIGIRRKDTNKPNYIDELYLMEDLDKILPRADVIALSLPRTNETYKLFSAERIAKMKQGSVIINVGRGNAIDTEALCDALESGYLSGAGLDVTDPEPLPPNHRLWGIKSAVITPHISGFYHLQETYDKIISISANNLNRFSKGEDLKNIVDFTTGYRKL